MHSSEPDIENKSGVMIAYEPKIENILPLPNERLIEEVKYFIKKNIM